MKAVSPEGKEVLFEVKARKDSFGSIYDFESNDSIEFDRALLAKGDLDTVPFGHRIEAGSTLTVVVSYSLYHVLKKPLTVRPPSRLGARMSKRFKTLQKLLGEAQILVLKDNGKPFLFLRFYE